MDSSTITMIAPDIECDGCAASIQKALGQEKGVSGVTVEVESQVVTVEYRAAETNPAALASVLADIGFPPVTTDGFPAGA